jgi:hypothetical protein
MPMGKGSGVGSGWNAMRVPAYDVPAYNATTHDSMSVRFTFGGAAAPLTSPFRMLFRISLSDVF